MKCIVVYFSMTGNTERVAKRIQIGVQQAVGNCDLVKWADANPRRLYEYDLIGLGTTSYAAPIATTTDFINKISSVGGKHAFAFWTHASLQAMPSSVIPLIFPLMMSRGMTMIGWAHWYGQCYLPWHTYPYPTEGHPDEIDLKEAEDFGREIVERSRRISAGEMELIPRIPEGKMPPVRYYPTAIRDLPGVNYHQEKCLYPNCRLCMDNCPVYGIDLTLNPRVVGKPCVGHCPWCAMLCPTGAIEIDDYLESQMDNCVYR